MKRFFKKLLFKDNGAVSIFAIMIVLPIFLVNALFIDTARIILAERQIENALDTAIRSTMANFNEKLASVGLFSYQGTESEAQSDFESYVQKQGFTDQNDSFSMARPKIESAEASFDTGRNLVDIDVFEYQVLESMKYQAPAQIGIEIFDLISTLDFDFDEDDVDSVEELGDKYEELFDLIKKRNEKIDDIEDDIQEYIEMIKDGGTLKFIIGTGSIESDPDIEIPERINSMSGFIRHYDRYQDLKEEIENNEDDDDLEDEEQEVENYENAVAYKKDTELGYFNSFDERQDSIRTNLFRSHNSEDSAEVYNDQIKEILAEIEEIGLDDSEDRNNLKKLILEDEFFTDIHEITEELYREFDQDQEKLPKEMILEGNISEYNTVVQLVDGFYKVIEEDKDISITIKNYLQGKYEDLQEGENTLENHFNNFQKTKKALQDEEGSAEEEEKKGDNAFNDLLDLINIAEEVYEDQQEYNKLVEIIEEYDGAVESDGDNDIDKSGFIKNAYQTFKSFLTFIKKFPKSFRNELYMNEYIMANYGGIKDLTLDKESFKYDKTKSLFITYGYPISGMNYAKFLLDIAMLVFVADLIKNVLTKGGFAGPFGFLRAVANALTEAVEAILQLTSKKGEYKWEPLKGLSSEIEVDLPTFLRIFMVMKSLVGPSYNDNKKRRLQAVLTRDTGVKLNDSPSYIEGTVEAEIDLLFIPAVLRALPDKNNKVKGNTYIIRKNKVFSY